MDDEDDWAHVQEGAWVNLRKLNGKAKKAGDAYDYDPNTVSPYDGEKQYRTFDWGVPEGNPGAYKPPPYGMNGLVQKSAGKRDEYDGDHNTVSEYDHMHQYKKFDWGDGKPIDGSDLAQRV